MIRRFVNRTRRGWMGRREGGIDAARWFKKIADDPALPVPDLEPVEVPGLPSAFAVAGKGVDEDGRPVRVAFSPNSGGDAWMAAIVVGLDIAASGTRVGEILAIAPSWDAPSRQRLSLGSGLGFSIRALEASSLRAPGVGLEPETASGPVRVGLEEMAVMARRPGDRELFLRAGEVLRGLAAKYGGVARGSASAFEIVIQGRRIAELAISEKGIELEVHLPQRASVRIEGDRVSDAADALEGAIRKHLSDRRVRNGEEALRARVQPLLVDALGLRAWAAWPLPGSDPCVIDVLGVGADGIPRAGVCREKLGLSEFGEVLDTLEILRASLPSLLPPHAAGIRREHPRLGLAANELSAVVAQVGAALGIETALYEVQSHRGRGVALSLVEPETVSSAPPMPQRAVESLPRGEGGHESESLSGAAPQQGSGETEGSVGATRGRSRRRRGGRGRGNRRGEASGEEPRKADAEARTAEESSGRSGDSGIDEVSLFDLEEDSRGASRGRSRGSRRGRRAEADSAKSSEALDSSSTVETEGGVDSRSAPELEADLDADAEMDDLLSPLPDEVSETGDEKPTYEDDEASPEETIAPAAQEVAAPSRPRKRSAILAHADRNSIMAAVLLARDIRMVEGIWVYPQDELMTFFKSVATDLRDDAPIYVIGFTPSPAREVLQAVSLYSGRLTWFDHQDWPPEDAQALRQVIGEDSVCLSPGAESSLPSVLEGSIRRSRFTDKLVDLSAGRFTDHDYEKWGRLWWYRLGELADRHGDRRADLDPLLDGRPSDLAKDAAQADTPPPPPEVAYVAERDFRLVHFANHSMVVVDAPGTLDCHLLGRVARERYGASLSLVRSNESETWVLTGEELSGRRSLDVGALVAHMALKLKWVEALPGEDRVARLRIERLSSQPHRLDEVIGMIAMGRSILER